MMKLLSHTVRVSMGTCRHGPQDSSPMNKSLTLYQYLYQSKYLHRNASSNTSPSIHAQWEATTQRLLLTGPRDWSPATLHQFQEALKYWTHQGNIEQCWNLLDVLASRRHDRAVLSPSLFRPVVHLWQKEYKKHYLSSQSKSHFHTPKQMQQLSVQSTATPEQVVQKCQKYQETNVISTPIAQRVGAMILDAAKGDLEFATTYLQQWIQDPTRDPPDVVAVGTVLQAQASHNPEQAEKFWNEILPQLPGLQPNQFWYTSMVSAWAKQGNTTKAMEWLKRMQPHYPPDLATWNSVLQAWAKSTKDPSEAEAILEQMQQLHQQGQLTHPPDVVSYSIVLDAWAQQAEINPLAANRAQQLLERMDTMANRISYNTVIQAFTRAGNPHQAELLLTRMIEHNIQPDDITLSVILSGWSRIGTLDAAERAEQILQQVMPQLGIQPSVITYSACLACWAKVKQPIAMQRAQALFDQLVQKQKQQPDVVAYTNLMHIYARHGKAEHVESLLQELLQAHHDSKDPSLEPNIHTFSVVVSAWSRRSAAKAQEWLSKMRQYGVEPNVVTYTTVLNAWSKQATADPSAPQRAHDILRQMSCPPNQRSYTAVIRAYAEQGRAQEAQTLLEEMVHQGPTPDVYTFSTVLYAWSKANPPLEAAQKAEQLLMKMPQMHRQQQPNVVCFGNVLLCWSRVHKGADRAEAILRTMKQFGVEPNLFCINIVLNALAKQSHMDETAVERARALLTESRTWLHLNPDEYTYRAIFKAIIASSLPNRNELAHQILEEMKQQGIRINSYYTERLQALDK